MNIEQKLRLIAGALDRLLPAGHAVEMHVRRYAGGVIELQVHGVEDYFKATKFMRSLGIGERNKSVWNDHEVRTVLNGRIGEGLNLTVFCSGLPPSCRIETFTERVPKTQVVENPTGEFVEIERTRVVCGHEQPQPIAEVAV